MSYIIDKSLAWNGIYRYSSESGTSYLIKITESSKNSGLWTMDFVKIGGEPSPLEVFKIMGTLFEASMEYVNEKNIQTAFLLINGKDKQEIEQKTKVFVRWLKDFWDYQILNEPVIKLLGSKDSSVTIPTNGIFIKRKNLSQIPKNNTTNIQSEIKFCFNCGTENKGFQFCPNCGTNLKQS